MGACNCKTLKEEPDSASKMTAAAAVNGSQKHSKAPPLNHLASHRAVKAIGRGAAADTWLFMDRKRNRLVAVKLFARPIPHGLRDSTVREITVQAELGPGHINLINVYELILSDDYLGLVMEYAQGGSLTAHVAERWGTATAGKLVMDEDEARYFFRQFIHAVDYCHKHNTTHRDLKLDNSLLDGQKPPFLKICDFGFASHFDRKLTEHLGTPEYMSPELLRNRDKNGGPPKEYDPRSVDVWAAGVMLIVSLCGAFPFDHTRAHEGFTDDQELDLWLQEVNKQWSESPFIRDNRDALSKDVCDLLNRIFVIDPRKRITIPEIMKHPWYNKDLASGHQKALERLQHEQAQVDEYISSRRLDQAKVEQRNKRIAEMVDKACTKGGKSEKSHVRPLQALNLVNDGCERLDLTDQAVLVDNSNHPTEDHATVADRAAGLDKGKSGKLHESDSLTALDSLSKGTPVQK